MAQRRMFSGKITNSDSFAEMPLSAQALYFHLGINADDDGFVDGVKRIQRSIGAAEDDLRLLIARRFILPFNSGAVVIRHWRIHNYIQKDRYVPTIHTEERKMLSISQSTEKGAYVVLYEQTRMDGIAGFSSDVSGQLDTECIQNGYNGGTSAQVMPVHQAPGTPVNTNDNAFVSRVDTGCIQDGYGMDTACTQTVSTGKVRLSKDRLGEGKKEKDIINDNSQEECARARAGEHPASTAKVNALMFDHDDNWRHTLKNHPAKVTTICDGFACSAASVIFMAGDTRIMNPLSALWIHNVQTWAGGDGDAHRKAADESDRLTALSKQAYTSVGLNINNEELATMMNAETWIMPADALTMGFATEISEQSGDDTPQNSARNSLFGLIQAALNSKGDPSDPGKSDDPDPEELDIPKPDDPDEDEPEDDPDEEKSDPDEDDEAQNAAQKMLCGFLNALINMEQED